MGVDVLTLWLLLAACMFAARARNDLTQGSSSMQPAIDTVRKGLTKFTDEIMKRDIDARYMIALYGVEPEIVLDWVCALQREQQRGAREVLFVVPCVRVPRRAHGTAACACTSIRYALRQS